MAVQRYMLGLPREHREPTALLFKDDFEDFFRETRYILVADQ